MTKEQERRAQLLRELAREVERHAAEVGVAQQIVQVVREQLEHEAQVVPPHEVPFQFHWNEDGGGLEKELQGFEVDVNEGTERRIQTE